MRYTCKFKVNQKTLLNVLRKKLTFGKLFTFRQPWRRLKMLLELLTHILESVG